MSADHRLSRRRLLGLSARGLLALSLGPAAWRAAAWRADAQGTAPGRFRFLAVNDTHQENERSAAFLDRAIETMLAGPKPDFCLLLGDLSHNGKEPELLTVKAKFERLGVPLWPVPGNHDYLTQTDRSGYDRVFPGRLNYFFEHKGWLFVGLDTTEGLRAEKTTIQPATLAWAREHLPTLDPQAPMVLFTHFPLGRNGPRQRPLNTDELLALFKDHNLRIVFAGHHHAFTQVQDGKTRFLTNRCCAATQVNHDKSKEKGYFLCEANAGNVAFSFVEVQPPPAPPQPARPPARPAAQTKPAPTDTPAPAR